VPDTPHVNRAETRKLFNAGAGSLPQIEKTVDPSCYDLGVGWKKQRDGLFEIIGDEYGLSQGSASVPHLE
jgi:hypothetical protein